MSLSSLFRFKISDEGLQVKNMSIAMSYVPNKTFIYWTKHSAKDCNKITMYESLLLLMFGKCRISQ